MTVSTRVHGKLRDLIALRSLRPMRAKRWRVLGSEPAIFNLVAQSQGTDDANPLAVNFRVGSLAVRIELPSCRVLRPLLQLTSTCGGNTEHRVVLLVSAGIKEQHSRRFCSRAPVAGTRYALYTRF